MHRQKNIEFFMDVIYGQRTESATVSTYMQQNPDQ